jgi:hypothetical protein
MSWMTKLPEVGEKKVVCVDANVMGNYFSERETTYAIIETVFKDPGIQIQCRRQVVDDAVNQLGRSVELRKSTREAFSQLQQEGKLAVTGAATLSPDQRNASQQLQRQLIRSMSAAHAALVAESLAQQLPLLTLEARIADGVRGAFSDKVFLNAMERHGLGQTLEILQPQPGASLITCA